MHCSSRIAKFFLELIMTYFLLESLVPLSLSPHKYTTHCRNVGIALCGMRYSVCDKMGKHWKTRTLIDSDSFYSALPHISCEILNKLFNCYVH